MTNEGNYFKMKTVASAPLWVGILGVGLLLQGCASTGSGGSETTALKGARGDVVMAALSQVGTRYKYGAEAPGKALDCSALTQHAHRAAGVQIPRVSTAQRKAAKPVHPKKAKPGDLVFFKIKPNQYHVGLMVDKKRFVHASTSKKRVRLSSLNSDYWQNRIIGAGTYLN
jgi:cell wall-associated NlpC family hydrolase